MNDQPRLELNSTHQLGRFLVDLGQRTNQLSTVFGDSNADIGDTIYEGATFLRERGIEAIQLASGGSARFPRSLRADIADGYQWARAGELGIDTPRLREFADETRTYAHAASAVRMLLPGKELGPRSLGAANALYEIADSLTQLDDRLGREHAQLSDSLASVGQRAKDSGEAVHKAISNSRLMLEWAGIEAEQIGQQLLDQPDQSVLAPNPHRVTDIGLSPGAPAKDAAVPPTPDSPDHADGQPPQRPTTTKRPTNGPQLG